MEAETPSSGQRLRLGSNRSRRGCITCRIRRIKCDEQKPLCLRCTSTGRRCDGYMPMPYSLRIAKQLAQMTAFVTPAEARALEFFFRKSAGHLAGYFGVSFWTRTVLQLSLTEPTIRHAIAAIGLLYEAEGTSAALMTVGPPTSRTDLALHLYNRAIRTTIDKASTGIDALPLVITASVLFASLEFLFQDAFAAASHVVNGLNLVRTWRQHRGRPKELGTSRAHWVDMELTPILLCFSVNTYEHAGLKHLIRAPREKVHVHPMDDRGQLILGRRFSTLPEARLGLLDLILYLIGTFQDWDQLTKEARLPSPPLTSWAVSVQQAAERWKVTFEALVQRKESTWGPGERNELDATRMLWYCIRLGTDRYRFATECGWDDLRATFEDIVESAERLLADSEHYPDKLSKTLNLDCQMLYPLQAVVWKCRWPHIRRRGLDLLRRIPKQELIFSAPNYHIVCSQIVAMEERALNLAPGTVPNKDMLPPDHARVYDFTITPASVTTTGHPPYNITFKTFPHGRNGAPEFLTEPIQLHPSLAGGTMLPVNLMKCRDWSNYNQPNDHAVEVLKGI
ncbi:hypothetical protein BO94DRAFT_568240 [Aspergillus sclerotioniger CBS 115572]|uniref:Zn(2)-C6 fungal-type domain-containing protein n=1 Tax=Aspergillus sclerotioniger CBS 115572 TaxID=1450535 RepID=A0A317VTK4_9EURO|nr:hypothetical protein BO94DRAFT_568240 [Aspergillus sclerotioniger CBS 115572]PWY77255.1 hypothetical protein BO94DRAFT_568240 [Aspergillus sclerotioniger CBS 115572]